MIRAVVTNVTLGVTHLLVKGSLVPLLKCPACRFKNIHKIEIENHIEFSHYKVHPRAPCHYELSSKPGYGPTLSKNELKLGNITCIFCNWSDKIEFDLSLHMLERHRDELMQIPISRLERRAARKLSRDPFAFFEGAMEYRLDKAVEMAKEKEANKKNA